MACLGWFLAYRAEVGAALPLDDALDGIATARAPFAVPFIDPQLFLLLAQVSVGIDILAVAEACSAIL